MVGTLFNPGLVVVQRFKTIYFSDYPALEDGRTGLTVSFSEGDGRLFRAVAGMSSYAIRSAIGHQGFKTVQAAAEKAGTSPSGYIRDRLRQVVRSDVADNGSFDAAIQSTFVGGKGSPLHDWFPYLEGYSPEFVRRILQTHASEAKTVLDPFCGSGTTALAAASAGLQGSYCEVNPVCRMVIQAKALALQLCTEDRRGVSRALQGLADDLQRAVRAASPATDLRESFTNTFGPRPFFSKSVFEDVLSLRAVIDGVGSDYREVALLAEVAVLGCLVGNSLLVRRGDLRFRTEAELDRYQPNIIHDVSLRLRMMASDLFDVGNATGSVRLATTDVRALDPRQHGNFDAIVTSPPYLNGTNYFRNTKIELWFTRNLRSKGELRAFRDAAITSGINDVTNTKTDARRVPANSRLTRSLNALEAAAYDQRIPKMVASYFAEMDEAAARLREVASRGACVAIDLGDSCYGNVHIETDLILRELLRDRGFKFLEEVVLRERVSRSGRGLRQTLQIFRA